MRMPFCQRVIFRLPRIPVRFQVIFCLEFLRQLSPLLGAERVSDLITLEVVVVVGRILEVVVVDRTLVVVGRTLVVVGRTLVVVAGTLVVTGLIVVKTSAE